MNFKERLTSNANDFDGIVMDMLKKIERQQAEIERLHTAINRALADSESGKGWGPDVTVCAYLREALKHE